MLRRAIDVLVYLSVILGIALLVQVNGSVPSAIFFSILAGWLVYVASAVLVFRGYTNVYPLVLVLAVLTLLVSLPQPAHYAFITNAQILAASTFILGSAFQVSLIVLIPLHLIRVRRGGGRTAAAASQ